MIKIDDNQLKNMFPTQFRISFNQFDKNISVKFIKTTVPTNEMNIYLMEESSGNPIKYDSTYREVDFILNH